MILFDKTISGLRLQIMVSVCYQYLSLNAQNPNRLEFWHYVLNIMVPQLHWRLSASTRLPVPVNDSKPLKKTKALLNSQIMFGTLFVLVYVNTCMFEKQGRMAFNLLFSFVNTRNTISYWDSLIVLYMLEIAKRCTVRHTVTQ